MALQPIFVLGSPNGSDGKLSPISLGRIERAIDLQRSRPNSVIMATGGFGAHFNTTPIPHREHAHRHLAARGAHFWPAEVSDLLSANTVEDASLIIAFADAHAVDRYAIVTSAFHLERCRFIFQCLEQREVDYFAARDPADLTTALIKHELRALEQLIAQGGVVIADMLYRHPLHC